MHTGQVPKASRTLGIDLASQPKETGVCLIDWSGPVGRVVELDGASLTDDVLVGLLLDDAVSKAGIDAPFGWPVAFIDAISSFRDDGVWMDLEPNEIRFRATDTSVWRETGQTPLSVAMSDLAWPAMRCARLLSRLSTELGAVDRTGAGRLVEVYPMAALRRWQVIDPSTPPSEWSYKGSAPGRQARREQHLARLQQLLDGAVEITDVVAARCGCR